MCRMCLYQTAHSTACLQREVPMLTRDWKRQPQSATCPRRPIPAGGRARLNAEPDFGPKLSPAVIISTQAATSAWAHTHTHIPTALNCSIIFSGAFLCTYVLTRPTTCMYAERHQRWTYTKVCIHLTYIHAYVYTCIHTCTHTYMTA